MSKAHKQIKTKQVFNKKVSVQESPQEAMGGGVGKQAQPYLMTSVCRVYRRPWEVEMSKAHKQIKTKQVFNKKVSVQESPQEAMGGGDDKQAKSNESNI